MTGLRRVALALVIALGCACRDREADANDFREFVNAMDRGPSADQWKDVALVSRVDLPKTELLPPIWMVVTPTDITLDGALIATLPEFRGVNEALAAKRADLVEGARKGSQGPFAPEAALALAIDGSVTWRQLSAIVESAVTAGFRSPSLVFARPANTPSRPRSWVDDAWRDPKAQGSNDEIVKSVFGSCRRLWRAFGDIGSYEGGDKDQELIEAIEAALRDGCNLNVNAVKALVWHIMGSKQPTTVIRVVLDRTGTVLDLPGDTTWQVASKRLKPDVGPIWFSVSSP
jgi:hypothetical protein